jgi:hypothetical protein
MMKSKGVVKDGFLYKRLLLSEKRQGIQEKFIFTTRKGSDIVRIVCILEEMPGQIDKECSHFSGRQECVYFSPSLDILLDQGNSFDSFSGGFRSGEKRRPSLAEIFELEADGSYIPLEIFFA